MTSLDAALFDLADATARLARVKTVADWEHVLRGGRLALAEAEGHVRRPDERRRYQDAATRWNSAALEARFPQDPSPPDARGFLGIPGNSQSLARDEPQAASTRL